MDDLLKENPDATIKDYKLAKRIVKLRKAAEKYDNSIKCKENRQNTI